MTKEEQISQLKSFRKDFIKRFKNSICSCCGKHMGLEIHHPDPMEERFFNLILKEDYEEILKMIIFDEDDFFLNRDGSINFLEGRTN